ncbi:MAG: glycosyltransferase family 39 protein [bacterium]
MTLRRPAVHMFRPRGQRETDQAWRFWFWAVLAETTTWRIAMAAIMGVCFDECYYHYWSLFPQLSYYDHPPLTAWMMHLSGMAFGESIWTVRLWPLLGGTVFVLAGRALARRLFGQPSADRAGIMLSLTPLLLGNGLIMTPDTLLAPCWALALYFAWRAIEQRTALSPWWIAAGLCAGIGALSKYPMALFFMGLALFWTAESAMRAKTWRGALICGVLTLVMFLPVIIWNSRNGWVSIRFQLGHGFSNDGAVISLPKLADYLATSLIVVTPLLCALCAWSSCRAMFRGDAARRFAGSFFLAVAAVFGAAALRGSSEANWVMPAFISGIVLVAGDWDSYALWLRRATLGLLAAAAALICAGVPAFVLFPGPLSSMTIVAPKLKEVVGSPELASSVRRVKEEQGADVVCALSHQLFGRLSYYAPDMRSSLYVISRGKLRFPWINPAQWEGKRVLIVSDKSNEPDFSTHLRHYKDLGSADISCAGGYVIRGVRYCVGKLQALSHQRSSAEGP